MDVGQGLLYVWMYFAGQLIELHNVVQENGGSVWKGFEGGMDFLPLKT